MACVSGSKAAPPPTAPGWSSSRSAARSARSGRSLMSEAEREHHMFPRGNALTLFDINS
ncbi:hypothetical protein MILUP08_40719 [Micromonospora lupini str. Lupac 08]|uniref:Uncharacterized protein n=1 Tax=Micromonospora lupini str. Lupac 08 TaxID=1150864 RepID=I0KW61_9ACTN|nr:hypothetical protein MILUP08_40719 [Micromonospora lupini str. Lupac 08]